MEAESEVRGSHRISLSYSSFRWLLMTLQATLCRFFQEDFS
jgi:hypothetical protein